MSCDRSRLEALKASAHLPFSMYLRPDQYTCQILVLKWFSLPTGTFWAEVNLAHDNEGWDGSGCHHPAPLGVLSKDGRALEGNRGNEPEHDTEGRPHLPHHGESTTNVLWCRFGSVYRRCARLGTDSETKGESSYKKVYPVVRSSHPDASNCRNRAGNEDRSATSKEFL